ncbi:MAG: carboxypeptidase-like regulatory domain-containing protein [Bacteroidota bacterium]
MKWILTIALLLCGLQAGAQEVAGKVLDDKKEPFISVPVMVYQGGVLKGGTITDYDGNYSVKPLEPGTYDVYVAHSGLDTSVTKGVPVSDGNRTLVNPHLSIPMNGVYCKKVEYYKRSLVELDMQQLLSQDRCGPTHLIPALYQSKRGRDVSIASRCRYDTTVYIIDGIKEISDLAINGIRTMCCLGVIDPVPWSVFFDKKSLEKMPYTEVKDIVGAQPNVRQQRRGDNLSVRSSDMDGMLYIVDGVQVMR